MKKRDFAEEQRRIQERWDRKRAELQGRYPDLPRRKLPKSVEEFILSTAEYNRMSREDLLWTAITARELVPADKPDYKRALRHRPLPAQWAMEEDKRIWELGFWLKSNLYGPRRKKTPAHSANALRKPTDPEQVVVYSKLVINALEEVLDYDEGRHHNRPPPDLRLEGEEYLAEVRNLVSELKLLIPLFQTSRRSQKRATAQAVSGLHKHFDNFFGKLSASAGTTIGTGIGGLLVGSVGALLYYAGLDRSLVQEIFSHFRIR